MGIADRLPPTSTRVELHTAPQVNQALRERTDTEVMRLEDASPETIGRRLAQFDAEWDIERVLQANASLIVLAGLALGVGVDRRFLMLPGAVFAFFAQHALQGWCPPIPLFRRMGVRTVREIERERHALKALRGDFDDLVHAGQAPAGERVRAALAAVDA